MFKGAAENVGKVLFICALYFVHMYCTPWKIGTKLRTGGEQLMKPISLKSKPWLKETDVLNINIICNTIIKGKNKNLLGL